MFKHFFPWFPVSQNNDNTPRQIYLLTRHNILQQRGLTAKQLQINNHTKCRRATLIKLEIDDDAVRELHYKWFVDNLCANRVDTYVLIQKSTQKERFTVHHWQNCHRVRIFDVNDRWNVCRSFQKAFNNKQIQSFDIFWWDIYLYEEMKAFDFHNILKKSLLWFLLYMSKECDLYTKIYFDQSLLWWKGWHMRKNVCKGIIKETKLF